MKITLRDESTGEFADRNGWTREKQKAVIFPTLIDAQSFCAHLRTRRVEALVERPNGRVVSIPLTAEDSELRTKRRASGS